MAVSIGSYYRLHHPQLIVKIIGPAREEGQFLVQVLFDEDIIDSWVGDTFIMSKTQIEANKQLTELEALLYA